jgi:hypothetical protein
MYKMRVSQQPRQARKERRRDEATAFQATFDTLSEGTFDTPPFVSPSPIFTPQNHIFSTDFLFFFVSNEIFLPKYLHNPQIFRYFVKSKKIKLSNF